RPEPALTSGAADMKGPSDKLFCCKWIRNWIPITHRDELYHILRMTGPLLLSRILRFLLPFIITIFCGRLGNDVLAGYGLASATLNITTTATGFGLGLACDTLVSQTFGGKNLLQVGVILQRGIIVLMLFCLPCWGLLINAQAILLCLGQDPEVVLFLHNLLVCYLQNQGIILPQMYTAALANVANVLTNYILLYVLDLGVGGSAAAHTLSQFYICGFLFAYIWWKKLHATTWEGWSVESLQDWGSYMKLAIPSTLMICFEWWLYEFGGFFAGMMSEDELAAQHAVIMVAFIVYMFPNGIQAAACARVGNALGAGDTAKALLTSKMSLTISGLVLGCTKHVIGFIFTSDEKIAEIVSNLMNVYCFLQLFDGLVCVCTGIFLGTGKQKIPAVANLIGYYCIGLPLSITLMFVAKLRILGFWLGLFICVVLQSTFYIIVIFRLNWKQITEEAVKRAKKKSHVMLLGTDVLSDQVGNITDGHNTTNGNVSSLDGYTSVKTEQEDVDSETKGGHAIQQQKTVHLSTTQLIIRRGLTMFAAVALLAVGAGVHFLVPLPETHSVKANFTLDWINTTICFTISNITGR
uniref:Multidrug and toxin extrusion protein n=1 Tax=Kryptolebias marmoratus TaxID=37003 RepID=A0A3Q3ARV4_KRYMA